MENLNFVAIDLETATSRRSSICEIGIAVVENSTVKEVRTWLVRPDGNNYDQFNISIHGITPEATVASPGFKDVWCDVLPYLSGKLVVAHSTQFDMYAIKDALDECGVPYPDFTFMCSYRCAKYALPGQYSYSLSELCKSLGIKHDDEHRAGSDAEACAKIFAYTMDKSGVETVDEFLKMYEYHRGEFHNDGTFKPFRRSYTSSSKSERKKASEYIGDPSKIDENNYFFGKSVCFTGKCSSGTRAELLQKIADVGGIPVGSVTSSTDVLVVGQQDYRVVGGDGMSSKQEKAMRMIDAGKDIEIMSEAEFLRMM